ncbi:MAG: hypothetical protein ACE5FW_01730 [Candidatus Aenigmatarchaeota archaeon]
MKLLTKAQEKKIKANLKHTAREDLRLYKKLYVLFKRVYKLESKKEFNVSRARKVEEHILKVLEKIRADVLAELNRLDLLKPRNDTERAIILAFGPFLSPEEKEIRELNKYLQQECGVSLKFELEERGQLPELHIMYKPLKAKVPEDLGPIEPTPHGFKKGYIKVAKKMGRGRDYVNVLMRDTLETLGIPTSRWDKFGVKPPKPEYKRA